MALLITELFPGIVLAHVTGIAVCSWGRYVPIITSLGTQRFNYTNMYLTIVPGFRANWSSHPKKKACSGNMGHTCLIFMGQTAVPLYAFLPGLT